MTTKRRIAWITAILLVLLGAGGGTWWHVRRNTGPRLLARAQLALRAGKFDKALQLADSYVARYPRDWRGYHTQALAYCRQGRYAEARQTLAQAAERNPGAAEVVLCEAETHFLPAAQILASPANLDKAEALRDAIAKLQKATAILQQFKPKDEGAALMLRESLGLNLRRTARAQEALARRLDKDATTADASRAGGVAEARRKESQEALAASKESRKQAIAALLAVVQDAPRRGASAEALIELCDECGDEESLGLARKAILNLDDPPPVAAMMLAVQQLRSSGRRDDATFRGKLGEVKQRLDELLSDHRDNARIKLERAAVALVSAETSHDPNEADLAERLTQEIIKAEPNNPGARLLHAQALISQHRYAEAERELYALKADLPTWPEAQYWYARAAQATGKAELAAAAMRTIVSQLRPDHVLARKYLAALSMQGSPTQALEDAKAAHDADPNDPEALVLFVQAAFRTDQPALARVALAAAESREDAGLSLLMAAADGYRIVGEPDHAREIEARVADAKPIGARDRQAKVQALIRTGRGAEADKLLAEDLQSDPNSPQAHFALARRYHATGRGLQAMEYYRRAVELDGQAPEYRLALAGLLADSGQLDEALAMLAPILATSESARDLEVQIKVLQGESVDAEAWLSGPGSARQKGLALARAYLRAGQAAQCIETCQAELKKDPDDLTCLLLLGQAYRSQGRADDCIKAWSAGVTASPTALRVYLLVASVLGSQAKPQGVAETLRKIPKARKEMVNAAVAMLHSQRREFPQAAALYAEVAADPASGEHIRYLARLGQATALARAGRSDQAIGELDKLIGQGVQPERTLAVKADILADLRRLPEAEAVLGELLAKAEKQANVRAIERIAVALAQIGRLEKALAALDSLQRLRPNDPRSYLFRAEVLRAAGKADQAPALLRKAIELQPAELSRYVSLAYALDAQQEPLAALEALRELEDRGRTGQAIALYHEGRLLAGWGLRGEATKRFEAVIDSAATPGMQLDLARQLASVGSTAKAKAVLVRIPEHALQYVPAQHELADLADPAHKLAILRSLAAERPGDPVTLAREMSILLADDKPGEALKVFMASLASKQSRGQSLSIPAAMAVMAAARAEDLASAAMISAMLADVTARPQWRWMAVALTMDIDPNTAAKLLPPPAQADLTPAALGLCLARRSADGKAAKLWADRIDRLDVEASKRQPPREVPITYRFLCALLAGDGLQIQVATKKLESAGGVLSRAGRELAARAGASEKAPEELVRLLKAQIALDLPQPDLAWHWAMEALKARPTCQWAAVQLLRAWTRPGQLQKVSSVLRPEDSYFARLIRARALLNEAKYADAAAIYRALAETHKDEPELLLDQAQAEELTGNLAEAQRLYRRFWEATKNPAAANNWAYLVTVLSPGDKDQVAEAQKLLADILKDDSPSMFRDTAGWIAHLQGRKADACRLLRQAIKGQPRSAEVHYHLGMAEAAVGNNGLARMHLDEAVRTQEQLRAEAKAKGKPVPLAEARAADAAKRALLEIPPPE